MITIDVPNVTRPGWSGGSYTIAFIYSNKGNYTLKGYYADINEYIKSLNIKYFGNFVLYGSGTSRNIWRCSNKNITIWETTLKKCKYGFQFHFKVNNYETKKHFKLKRLPNKYVNEIFN